MIFSKSTFIQTVSLLSVVLGVICSSVFATNNSINPKNEVPLSELPPQVCGIEFKRKTPEAIVQYPVTERNHEKSNNDINCTATIIAPRLILTAKHCLKNLINAETAMVCPGGRRIPFDMSKEAHSRLVNSKLGEPNDIGVIELKEDIGIPPVQLPSTKAEVERLVKNPERCLQIGYGTFTHLGENIERSGLVNGSYTYGLELTTVNHLERENHFKMLKDPLNDAHLPISQFLENNLLASQNFLTQIKTDVEKPYLFLHGKGVAVSRGDSGGPLLCRNEEGNWVHLGVLTTGYSGFAGVYINTWSQRKWLGHFLPKHGITSAYSTDFETFPSSSLVNSNPCMRGICKNSTIEMHAQFVKSILQLDQEIILESKSSPSNHDEQALARAKEQLKEYLEFLTSQCNSKN